MSRPARARLKVDLAIGLALFISTLFIFLLSPVHQLTDSNYSMLLSQSLWQHRTFTLEHYAIPRHTPINQNKWVSNGDIYQLEIIGDHLYYFFPPGTSILSLPYVAVMNKLGVSATNSDGSYNPAGEEKIQTSLAALLMATLASVLFFTARLLLPVGWSLLVAIGGALGTQVWSTASRGMWSDTWGLLLLGVVILMLLAHETGKRRFNAVLLASLLAWLYFVRPTNAIPIIGIGLYILIFHRRRFVPFALTGLLWIACSVFYSWYHFRQLVPNYYLASRLSFDSFGTALAGNLLSPSRGVLIFVPVLFFIIYLLVRYRAYLFSARLVVLAVAVIVSHLIVISGFSPWHGGGAYGPRYATPLVPWFVLLGILGLHAMFAWREQHRAKINPVSWSSRLAVGGLLLALSIFINARGAISYDTWMWNGLPVTVDERPGRVWDWREPQFLAGYYKLHRPTLLESPEQRAFVRRQYLDFLHREPDRAGWDFWTDNITKCLDAARRPTEQTEAECLERQRVTTSGAFFLSPEFQHTGYFVYRFYKGGLGRLPKLSEFTADTKQLAAGIMVNDRLSVEVIERNKSAYARQFVTLPEFVAVYGELSNDKYVARLFQTTNVPVSEAEKSALVAGLDTGAETRAGVLQKIVDGTKIVSEGDRQFTTRYGQAFYEKEYNNAFVMMLYFGYLQRDLDTAGYQFWLNKLNYYGNYLDAERVRSFIISPEYKSRVAPAR